MNKEIREKWIKALRSGKYKQGTGTLRTPDDKFCCLGVLADVALDAEWQMLTNGKYALFYENTYWHGNLPREQLNLFWGG